MYQKTLLELPELDKLPNLFLSYISQNQELVEFYGTFPSLDNFEFKINQKNFSESKRELLVRELTKAYEIIQTTDSVKGNIQSLKNKNTFTVTTGHQLCLFTGPLYFIYKIITTIKLCKELKNKYPNYNFVPVYWMASEDHDFEEVNHFYHFNKKYSWADNQTGAVGKFSTKGLENLINEIKDLPHFVISAYLESKTLSEATHKLVNELFGNYGLVVIDADNRNLKNNFSSHIQADIFEQKAFKTVAKQSKSLQKLGFETQVNAREINFFYLEANQRERIILEDNRYKILNTSISFSENELRKEIQNFPEKFSPNVIIRPLYQEHILPNLAYIGGPSELAYWLQFKTFFEESRVDFPILFPRNFGMIVNQSIFSKIQKFQLDYYTLIKGEDAIKEHYFSHFSKINNNIEPNISNIDLQISQIKAIALELDKTLDGFIESQKNDIHKTLDNISKKLKKVREQKEAEGLKQILNTRQKLFPDGNLQERRDNFLTFYLNNPLLIENLLQLFSPFDFKFHVLTEKANV